MAPMHRYLASRNSYMPYFEPPCPARVGVEAAFLHAAKGRDLARDDIVSRVEITNGNAALGPDKGPGIDLVAMDDFCIRRAGRPRAQFTRAARRMAAASARFAGGDFTVRSPPDKR